MNIWDILILAAIAAAVLLGVRRMRKKGGTCNCQGSCPGCGQCAQCRGTAGEDHAEK